MVTLVVAEPKLARGRFSRRFFWGCQALSKDRCSCHVVAETGLARKDGSLHGVLPDVRESFYAYPARPPALAETLDGAISDLTGTPEIRAANLRFRPWPDMAVSGKRLLREITDNIDRASIFACDVTYVNDNVAFELGYAIGRFKRVWLSLDTSIANANIAFNHGYTGMLGAGYASYENHEDLAAAFLKDSPWTTAGDFLLAESYRDQQPLEEFPTVLYVKPPHDTDSVIAVGEALRRSVFSNGITIDDPSRERRGYASMVRGED